MIIKRFISSSRIPLVLKTIPPNGTTHSASVIFFHGSGNTGENTVEWIRFLLRRNIEFPHIKLLFPTAPRQSYTALKGKISNVWFDRHSVSMDAKENRDSLAAIYEPIKDLITSEIENGIPDNRIVIGGFSMGGTMAMHTAYHLNTKLRGAFVCSSFLNRDSIVYESLKNRKTENQLPELLMFHGDKDPLVSHEWGRETFDELQKFGVSGEFTILQDTYHELKKNELLMVESWIKKVLPPLSSDKAQE